MSSKKRVKNENIEIVAGGSNKRVKNPMIDPFAGKYSDVIVEVYNLNMGEICKKLFGEEEQTVRFEVKNYKFEICGVSKTVCGETRFLEESKAILTITFETTKKEELITLLQDRFPNCSYAFK